MRIPNYRQRGRATTANRGSLQSHGLVGWFPFNTNSPLEPLTRTTPEITGNASVIGNERFQGLYGPNTGTLTGAKITTLPSTLQLNKPLTLVWIGYVFSNGSLSVYPRLIGVQHNSTDSSPFSAYEIGRPGTSVNDLFTSANSNGTQVYNSTNISLSSRYNTLLVVVATFTTGSVKLYVNGVLASTSTGIAGTIQYGSNPPLLINRANISNGMADTLTLDARIYNRELSEREITELYPNGWLDLYYNFAHSYDDAVLSRGDFFSMMTGF